MRWCLLAGLFLTAACAHERPPASSPAPDVHASLEAADALVRAGCFDCLQQALDRYDALRSSPVVGDAGAIGSAQAAALLSLRQRELGMTDDGYMARAREAVANREGASSLALALDVADLIPWRLSEVRQMSDDEKFTRDRQLREGRHVWSGQLQVRAPDGPFWSYMWLALMCGSAEGRALDDRIEVPVASTKDVPLVAYRDATCFSPDLKRLEDIVSREPRFVELDYFEGLQAIMRGRLEDADQRLRRAHAWHPRWPAVTLALGNVALTAEDFQNALTFYDETLTLVPRQRDGRLGRVRALSYLERHDDAIAQTDVILQGAWDRGDAYYWRAWNDVQLKRLDEAWHDIEEAAKLLMTADVSKLAGVIAYRRQQLPVARAKFEEGQKRNPNDCEMGFYLGNVDADLRDWQPSADLFVAAVACFEGEQRDLEADIARVQSSSASPERKARIVLKRQERIAADARNIATAWFNASVGYFNLSRKGEARQCAEKVAADPQYGERAKEILTRLDK